MKWQSGPITGKDIYKEYEEKYGSTSDYQVAQKIMYSFHEIHSSLTKAFDWLIMKPGQRILDIGVNNGYELTLMEHKFGRRIMSESRILGFDLAEDALKCAAEMFSSRYPYAQFIRGDIRDFRGVDVVTKKKVRVQNGSIDLVLAFTSLQSTSLSSTFPKLIKSLVSKLSRDGQLFIVVPNCHVNSRREVVKGLVNGNTHELSDCAAEAFCARLVFELNKRGFCFKKIGEHYIFLYFYKPQVIQPADFSSIFFSSTIKN